MQTFIFIFATLALLALCIYVGTRGAKREESEEEFFLMGRRMGWLSLTFTLLATQLGGGYVLGAADLAYREGWVALLFPLGGAIGLLALASGFGARLRRLQLTTISELFSVRYGSPVLRRIAGALSLISLSIILVGQGVAARLFFAALDLPPSFFVLVWSGVLFYTTLGGMQAVVKTDVIQAVMVLVTLCLAVLFHSPVEPMGVSAPVETSSSIPWIGWLLMPFLFIFIEQDMAQRCFSADTPRSVTWGAALSATLLFSAAIVPVYFGVSAAQSGLPIPEGKSVLLLAIQSLAPAWVAGLFMCAIVFVILSTADSLLCAAASGLNFDFPEVSHRFGIWGGRVVTLIIGVSSLVFSFLSNDVVVVIILSYELCVATLTVPLVLGALLPNPPIGGAWGGVLVGGAAFIATRLIDFPLPKELVPVFSSAVGYTLGALLVRRRGVPMGSPRR